MEYTELNNFRHKSSEELKTFNARLRDCSDEFRAMVSGAIAERMVIPNPY